MISHAEALGEIHAACPDATIGLALLARAVGYLESSYGYGWRGAGATSHNMGAIIATPSWTGPTFQQDDPQWDPKTGKVEPHAGQAFKAYTSRAHGWQDLVSLLRRRYAGAVSAAERGEWSAVPRAMYGYYRGVSAPEKAIATYAGRLAGVLRAQGIDPGPGWPGSGPSGALLGALVACGVAVVWVVSHARR